MSDRDLIPQGPSDFERLLSRADLSEREAQAVRSVALSLTAAEAAPLIGVSSSTVGSYRQRAYAKLGVSGRSEFLRLPEVASWTSRMQEERNGNIVSHDGEKSDGGISRDTTHVRQNAPAAEGAACADPGNTPPAESPRQPTPSDRGRGDRSVTKRQACAISLVTALICALLLGISSLFLNGWPSREYASAPQGVIASQYGDVPNVVGMRADAAASEVANAGFCPEFKAYASSLSPGTVLSIEKVGGTEDLGTDVVTFSWEGGSAGCYEEGGAWAGYVVLAVAA